MGKLSYDTFWKGSIMSNASMALIRGFKDTEVKSYETPGDSVTGRQSEDNEHLLVGAKGTIAGELMEACRITFGAPELYTYLTLLGINSTLLGRSVKGVGGSQHGESYPNLFTLTAVEAAAYKSVVYALLQSPVNNWEEEQRDKWNLDKPTRKKEVKDLYGKVTGAKKTAEGKDVVGATDPNAKAEVKDVSLDGLKKDLYDKENETAPIVSVNDITPEKVEIELKHQNKKLGLWSDEAGSNINNILRNPYGKGPTSHTLWNNGWSNQKISTHRVDKDRPPIVLKNAILSIVYSTQPHYADKLVNDKQALLSGLLSRFLIEYFPSELILETEHTKPIPDELKKRWNTYVREHLDLRQKDPDRCMGIKFSKEAAVYLRELHNKHLLKGHKEPPIQSIAKRVREQAIRISINLAILHDKGEVDLTIAKWGGELASHYFENTRHLLKREIKEYQTQKFVRLESELKENSGKLHKRTIHRNLKIDETELKWWLNESPEGEDYYAYKTQDGKHWIGYGSVPEDAEPMEL